MTNFDSVMDITPRPPIVFVAGQGSWLTDSEGRRYLDFIQGWAVNTLGHSPRQIRDALAWQARRLINSSPAFYNDQMIRLSDLLVRHSGLHQVFLANSGAEANEGAIKLARKWGAKYRDGAFEIITMDHGFHGRTLATMAASGKAQWEQLYEPKVSGFIKVPLNDLAAVAAAISSRTVAVMLEPIQGEAGVLAASDEFLRGVSTLTREKGILLILDEIQTGIGRTGRMFGFEHVGARPDIMTLAKGLGGGVPIGAILCTEKANVFTYGDHGSTFGGNPLATAVALAVMRETIKEDLPGHAKKVGNYLQQKLNELRPTRPYITDVRGHGLLVGIEFDSEIAGEVMGKLLSAGVLMNAPAGNILRFMPPLVMTEEEVDEVVGKLATALDEVKAKSPA